MSPKRGVFLPLKHPGVQPPEFPQGQILLFHMYIHVILLLGNFQQNLMKGKSSMSKKVQEWAKPPHFYPF